MTTLKDTPDGQAVLKAVKVTGFFAVTDSDYDKAREITKYAVGLDL